MNIGIIVATDEEFIEIKNIMDSYEERDIYELTFVKTLGHNGICPNCGAKLPKTNVCDYCHSVVPNSGSDWVLAKKQTLQQK